MSDDGDNFGVFIGIGAAILATILIFVQVLFIHSPALSVRSSSGGSSTPVEVGEFLGLLAFIVVSNWLAFRFLPGWTIASYLFLFILLVILPIFVHGSQIGVIGGLTVTLVAGAAASVPLFIGGYMLYFVFYEFWN